ncbi:hypothetical protein AWC38_SpisGene23662 [Stylophora pistillata]|uniref:Uncharacterized protein n=1 Tax=Stylophora pistillata TaxID=50429 RepID=A0A2B4R7R3_STYPI|nr:hypothetical protein AWC38_SpisGene23662 [Stylophora pistillata]
MDTELFRVISPVSFSSSVPAPISLHVSSTHMYVSRAQGPPQANPLATYTIKQKGPLYKTLIMACTSADEAFFLETSRGIATMGNITHPHRQPLALRATEYMLINKKAPHHPVNMWSRQERLRNRSHHRQSSECLNWTSPRKKKGQHCHGMISSSTKQRKMVSFLEMPLPFKHQNIPLPNNYAQAEKHLNSLRKRLVSDARYYTDHCSFMSEIISKGYTRKVGEEFKGQYVSFVMGKARVTPKKTISILGLELVAATLSLKIGDILKDELEYGNIEDHWTNRKEPSDGTFGQESTEDTSANTGPSVADEEEAEVEIIKQLQRDAFPSETKALQNIQANAKCGSRALDKEKKTALKKTSYLHKLDPFLDRDGIIRVRGRIRKADLLEALRTPIIRPK